MCRIRFSLDSGVVRIPQSTQVELQRAVAD